MTTGPLTRLNPLSKVAAILPALVVLVFSRTPWMPLAFLVLAYLALIAGARMTRLAATLLFVVLPAVVAVFGVTIGVWTDADLVADTPVLVSIGAFDFHLGAYLIGLTTALRLASLFALALVSGLTTTGPDLVRSLVQQLRVPYRIGYAALASVRFVPRFGLELELIRSAHRVRGASGGRGPVARVRRSLGYVVPLLAGAIRHAERVSMAMDSRAFGAHPTRTERHVVPFRPVDVVFVVCFWAVSAAIVALTV